MPPRSSRSLIRPRHFSGLLLPPILETEPSIWHDEEGAYVMLAAVGDRDQFITSWQPDDNEYAPRQNEYTITLKATMLALGGTVGLIVQLSSLAVSSCVCQRLSAGVVGSLGLLWCVVACAGTFAAARYCQRMVTSKLLLSQTCLQKTLDLQEEASELQTQPQPSADADETDPMERCFITGALAGILLTATFAT
jgi:hypothetical protein